MTEKQDREEHLRAVRAAVDEALAEGDRTREKYGHPSPGSEERQEQPTIGFIRWFEKGGHLDPAEEAHNAEYDRLWKKYGGGRDEITLDDGSVVRRSRAPEDPGPARGTSGQTVDAVAQPQDHIPSKQDDGDLHDDSGDDKPDEGEKKSSPARPTAQGLTKANTPALKSAGTPKTTKS